MKNFLLLVGALAGFVPAFALTLSAPQSVQSGTAYTVTANHWENNQWAYGLSVQILKNGAYVAGNGGGGYGYVNVTATYNTTDTGAQTVNYQATASGGAGSYSTSTSVQIIQPNVAPTITWVQNPANVATNQWFAIQARGNDADGNLTNVFVWREWTPHAFSGGGNGYESYSDANGYSQSTPGTVTFMAQAQDSNGATSPVIYHTVNIYAVNGVTFNSDTWPTGSVYVNQGVGFQFNVTNSGSKTWGGNHYIGLRDGNWQGVTFPSVNGWAPGTTGNVGFGLTAPSTPGNYTYYVQALENGVEWFGPVITKTLSVPNRAPVNAAITATVNGVGLPNNGSMQLGETVSLGASLQDPDGNLAWHGIYYQRTTGSNPDPGGWILLGDGTPSGGGNSTKNYNFSPNQSGRYDFHTNGHDGSIWGPGASVTVYVYGTNNGAAFVSQSVPTTMTTGDSFNVTVTMQNAGGSDRPWTNDSSPHKLKSVTATNWGLSSVPLPGGSSVLPVPQSPNTATFNFNVIAPNAPGNYLFQWQMMEEFPGNPSVFGGASTMLNITVNDNDAPSVPAGLYAAGVSYNAFTLNWSASTDNAGVTQYEIERQGAGVVTATSPTYSFSGLTPNTNYQVRVRARDAAANWSGWSGWLGVTTGLDPVADNDDDGMPNGWEQTYGLNPLSNADAGLDPDNDGFTNVAEYNLGKNPNVYDQGTSTLGNAIPGGWPNGGINAQLAVGATAGELNVDKSGAATYSVPIWTTPGTAGMQPQVSLNYSSQGGAGIAGFGWSLSGVSAITRGPTSLAVDSFIDGVDFDNNDQFYLDGQRLIYIDGGSGHGTSGARYRTELETFTKVVANGTAGNGPASFTAWTKAGLIIEFGTTADSAFNPGGGASVLSWQVRKISDTKGNYMTFTYDEGPSTAYSLLTRIDYTGNGGLLPYASLRFEYEDRPDSSRGFVAGLAVDSVKRLKTVKSCYGEQVARTYTLNYTNRTTANPRSLLTSLTETGTEGKSYPALAFEYEEPTGGWTPASFLTPAALAHLDYEVQLGAGIMDLDADGFADFVRKKTSNSGVLYNDAWLNRPAGWTPTPGSGLPDYRIIGDAMGLAYEGRKDAGTRFADINGDGLVDVVFSLKSNSGVIAHYLAINNGTGWSPNSTWTFSSQSGYPSSEVYITKSDGQDYGRRLVDINGDGLVDLVWNFDDSPNDRGCLINNTDGRYQPSGQAWVRADQWTPKFPISGNVSSGSQFMDVNGDGLPDQIQFGLLSNATEAGVALNSSAGWTAWQRVALAHGDSITAIRNALGTIGKYLPPALLGKDGSGYAFTTVGSEIADLNGDGLPDLIFSNPNLAANPYLHATLKTAGAWLNTGDGWVQSAEYAPPAGVYWRGGGGGGADSDPTGAVLVDLNGDGLPDLAAHRSDQSSSRYYYLNTGRGWGAYNTSYLGGADLNLPHALAHGAVNSPAGTQLADVNGDGIADSVFSDNTQPYVYPQINQANPKADRLKKVTNGLGVAASITYALLNERDAAGNATIYTKGTGGPADSINIAGPMLVTKAVTHDDGTGGQYEITYKYAGLRSHRFRGSLGFEQMTVTDSRTAIRSETTFAQVYPFTGMPISSKTISGSVTLKDSLVVYQEKPLNAGKTRFVFAKDSDEISRDLNGSTLGSTSTSIPLKANPADGYEVDNYGNILKITVDTDGYIKATESDYTNDDSNWFLGRLISAKVTTSAPGQTTQVRTSSFTYNLTTGLLETETVQPGDAVLGLTTTYGYDQFGNKTSVSVSGSNLAVDANGNYSPSGTVSRTTTTQYDGNGRFPSWTRNALNHQENYTEYDQVKGVLKSMTGANGLGTSWSYDGFGRKIEENRADGTISKTTYRWVTGAPAQAKYLAGATVPTAKYHVETESSGAPPALAFYDAFGRAFLSLGVNGDGNIVYTTTHHDSMGRAFAASVPYLASSAAWWTRTTAYDLLNRPLTVITPDDANGDQTTSYSYNGLVTEVTDPKGRTTRTVKNSQGWNIEITRNIYNVASTPASRVTYVYDVIGNLTTTVADDVTTSLNYDARGRKTGMTDADMGTWLYRYNVFGELIWQKDAKGQIVTMVYDQLGRLTQRTEAEGPTNWTYDSSPTRGIGKLHTVTAPAGAAASAYAETYLYDNYGRPSQVTRTIDGLSYVTQTAYDSVGRVSRTVYPTSVSGAMSTRNVYNDFGYLKEIRNWIASDDGRPNSQLQGKVYWMADSYAITGQINGETYGNGLANDRAYSAVTGRLYRATIDRGSVITAPFFVQDLNYAYDAMGNVKSRIEYTTGFNREERFSDAYGNDGYDGLDRLKVHRIVGGATVTVDYDAKGNITNKSDVGGYTYFANRPHAVQVAGVNSDYTYDAVGNMLTGAGRTLEWTSYNQLKKVTQGTKSSEFAFGAGHERVLQISRTNGTVTNRTVYVGGLYERVQSAGGLIEHKHYIMGPTGRIAVFTERSDLTKDTRWFHTDGLGSITVISDENGRVLKRHTYDAWGKQGTSHTNTGSGITNTAPSTRGYTDHEMLSDFGLIHMNGRVYDPVLGRFLSADPNVDGVEDAQGYNRYSYVGNNPMNATDPSGYFSLKDALKVVAIAVAAWFTAGLALQAWAVVTTGSGFVGGLGGALASVGTAAGWSGGYAIAAGVGAGFGAGFAGSLLNGGSIGDAFKAGLIGGLVGGISAGVAGKIGDLGLKHGLNHLAHGVTQGALTELQGGEFRHGFYAAFASSAAGGPIRDLMPDSMTGRTIAAAIVGGTASAIGGGKFANGAVTAAFTHLFNYEAHNLGGEAEDRRLWWEKLGDGYYYGTGYGEDAVQFYANVTLDPNASWYAKTGAYVGGTMSALWTRETYKETGWTLVTAGAETAAARRITGTFKNWKFRIGSDNGWMRFSKGFNHVIGAKNYRLAFGGKSSWIHGHINSSNLFKPWQWFQKIGKWTNY